MKVLLALLAIGFLAAIVVSWLYELTPEGLRCDGEVDPSPSFAPQTAQRMGRLIFAGLVAPIAVIAADRCWPRVRPPATSAPLAAEATAAPAPSSGPTDPPAPAATIDPNSIAVLPSVSMSADKANE